MSGSHGRIAGCRVQRTGDNCRMVTRREIQALARRIADEFTPERIVLFGSHVCGTPTADSDVDLLIVMSHEGPAHRAAAGIRLKCDVDFPLDILVRSPGEVASSLARNDPFMREVLTSGVVLHEADRAGMVQQGRTGPHRFTKGKR